VVSLGHAIEKNGWLAFRFLEVIGGFPKPREERPPVVQQPTAAEVEEARIQAACARFAAAAYERSRAFDAPLVDVEKDLHAQEGKLNGTAGNSERLGKENYEESPVVRRSIFNFKDED
jgi:hypothetical protein